MHNAFPDQSPAGAGGILTRDQIPEADRWDLSLLYPDPAAWRAELGTVAQDFPAITKFKGRLAESASVLRECLEHDKSVDLRLEKLFHYASLQTSEDGSNSEFLGRMGELQNLYTRISEAASFLTPEIQAIDDDTFAAMLEAPELAEWRSRLSKLRRFKPHVLPAEQERILAIAESPLRGVSESYSQLTNVDMRFGVVEMPDGTEKPLSQGSFSSFLMNRDPEVRKRAFHRFYKEFEEHEFTTASMLAGSIRTDVFRAKVRNYPSALEASLFSDAVPVAIYDSLIAAVRNALPALHEYYELRRELLKLDEIHHYDTYVPLVSDIDKKTTFDEATEMVCQSLAPLGSEYVDALREGMRNRWCDRYESKGKRSGAFSSGSYGNPPYMLMNYQEDVFSDVYTLAHEAGHSMHTLFAQRTQTYQDHHYPIFLAEVASTFNEELLTHWLLQNTDEPRMRAYIINRQIDDIRGTIFRQTMFAEFEKLTHEAEERGDALTNETFRTIYRGLLNPYFGEKFTLDKELEIECLRIPHFYSAFYVYKYATGLSAASALAQRVLTSVPGATDAYLGFLKSGGSQMPLETLQSAGVDLTKPDAVGSAIATFKRRVAELRELLA